MADPIKRIDYRTKPEGEIVAGQGIRSALAAWLKGLPPVGRAVVAVISLLLLWWLWSTFTSPGDSGISPAHQLLEWVELVLVLVAIFGLPVWGFFTLFQRDKIAGQIRKSGYMAPSAYSWKLTLKDKLARSKMPPFRVYFYPYEFTPDNSGGRDITSVMDGNHALPQSGPPKTFIQPKIINASKFGFYECHPDDAANLTRGPRERRTLRIKQPGSDRWTTMTWEAGIEGGSWPVEPQVEQRQTKGSAVKADLSDWEEG